APPGEQLDLLWQGHTVSAGHRPAQGLFSAREPRQRTAGAREAYRAAAHAGSGPRADFATLPGPPGSAGRGFTLAGPRSRATPPASPGRPQARAPAREPGAAPPAGVREPALDRHRDPDVPRWSGGEPARRPPAPTGQLSP